MIPHSDSDGEHKAILKISFDEYYNERQLIKINFITTLESEGKIQNAYLWKFDKHTQFKFAFDVNEKDESISFFRFFKNRCKSFSSFFIPKNLLFC